MAIKSFINKVSPKKFKAGFGLIELVVSIGIMILILTVVIVRQSAFNGASLLRNQVYVVALAAREVQLLAVSSERSDTGFRNVYGLHFSKNAPGLYKIFRDGNANNFFDAGEEYGKQSRIDGRFTIGDIRLIGGAAVDDVSIVFERPNFDAGIYTAANNEAVGVSGVEIDFRVKGTEEGGPGNVRTLVITKTGQISVKENND